MSSSSSVSLKFKSHVSCLLWMRNRYIFGNFKVKKTVIQLLQRQAHIDACNLCVCILHVLHFDRNTIHFQDSILDCITIYVYVIELRSKTEHRKRRIKVRD